MNPTLMYLINQGLIHGPKIPQYAQNVARGGEKVVRGGINTLNKYANPVLNKIFNTKMGVPIHQQSSKAPSALGDIAKAGTLAMGVNRYADDLPALIEHGGYFSGADDVGNAAQYITTGKRGEEGLYEGLDSIVGSPIKTKLLDLKDRAASLIESIINSDSEDKKETKKETKKSDDGWNIDDLPLDAEEAKKLAEEIKRKKNLHKGGYVKKQRKRKPYKSSGFVKMKKSKKRKYI